MNKTTKYFAGLVAGLFLNANVIAGPIAVFDHQRAIVSTAAAKELIASMEKAPEYKQLVTRGEALQADLQALKAEFDKDGLLWSDETKAEKNTKAESLQKELQEVVGAVQRAQAGVVGNLGRDLQKPLEEILQKILKEKKLDAIVQRQSVYIADPSIDITSDVVSALDAFIAEATKKAEGK